MAVSNNNFICPSSLELFIDDEWSQRQAKAAECVCNILDAVATGANLQATFGTAYSCFQTLVTENNRSLDKFIELASLPPNAASQQAVSLPQSWEGRSVIRA